MADKKKGTKKSQPSGEKAAEKSNEQVQEAMDRETDRGYRGDKVDPTPNENYTVEGVLAGKPTPEQDRGTAKGQIQVFVDDDGRRVTSTGETVEND